MKPLKVLSLFDGISCGMVALERAGIPVERYVAYEIDKNAIKVSEKNYPMIEHRGDVFDAEYVSGEFDLLIGGSPCTYWSIARVGNGGTRETKASGLGWDLFSQYVRAIRTVKPRYFLYENNVSMSEEIKECISNKLGVSPVEIDSADFSAQHRHRLYWTNILILEHPDKCQLTFADIEYRHNYTIRDFSKYRDTVRYKKDGSGMVWDSSGKGYYSQGCRCRYPQFKTNTVLAGGRDRIMIYCGEYKCRYLHQYEFERLQTLPDGYTDAIEGITNKVKAIGNGWTVDVIAHIFKGLKEEVDT